MPNQFSIEKAPVVLVPELFRSTGGVQVFSRRMIEALDSLFGSPVTVVSRNDRRSDCPESFLQGRHFSGCGSLPVPARKLALPAAALRPAAPWYLSTHPNFALFLRFQKKPFALVTHGIDVWNMKGTPLARALSAATRVLPVSRFTESRMQAQLGSLMPPSTVFPNTFDTQRFTASPSLTPWRQNLHLPEDAQVMLSVCRVSTSEAEKGYHLLLSLLPKLFQKHPNLYWVLGGQGDDLCHVKEKAAHLGVSDRCRFPGFIPDETLPDLYRSSDLFVLPSQKEGFGIVFLEAAATGLPVIAGNRDGSVDALANGELGTLVDPTDPTAISNAISEVIDRPRPDRAVLHQRCATLFGQDAFRDRLSHILPEFTA